MSIPALFPAKMFPAKMLPAKMSDRRHSRVALPFAMLLPALSIARRLMQCVVVISAIACIPVQAGPFDVLDKVKNAVDSASNTVNSATNTAKDAVDTATGAKNAPTGSNAEAGQLAVKALVAGNLTPEGEVAIGTQIAGNLLGAAPLVKDSKLQNYVNRVGTWVAAQTERRDGHWRFGVIQSDDVNAFAAPGGFVFITLGLYRLLDNEAELAAVLGHEIGHVVRHHHLDLLKKSAMLGALSNVVGNRVAGKTPALQGLIGNGAEIMARGLDKSAEYESDRLGIVYATRAGYDPFAMFAVLEKIDAAGTANAGPVALLYKTHPRPEDRLNALADAAADHFDHFSGLTLEQRFYRLSKK